MALIKYGSFGIFSAKIASVQRATRPYLELFRTVSDIREATRAIQPAQLELDVSSGARGLALKSLKLTLGFEGFMQNFLNPTNEVYFLAWSWDLSGAPIFEYPGINSTPQQCIIPMKPGFTREFLGSGALLFPARRITGGLAVRIMIWESDQGMRAFGNVLTEVSHTIKTSKLHNLLTMISLGAGITTTTISLVKEASVELANCIGKILQANSDDFVDFFEGYYPAADGWLPGEETYRGNACEITLARL